MTRKRKPAGTSRAVKDDQVVKATRSLETGVHEAMLMAGIAADMVDEVFGDFGSHREITCREDFYYFSKDTIEKVTFTVFQAERMIKKLRADYSKALDGDEAT